MNNEAHETVGGMPTVASNINISEIAKACGYKHHVTVDNFADLDNELLYCKNANELCLLEIKCSIGSRSDLGRPKEKPFENKNIFMKNLQNIE